MKKVFKLMMALGLGIGLLGLVVLVVGLVLGGRPSSMYFRDGHIYFDTWQSGDILDNREDLPDLEDTSVQTGGDQAAFRVENLRQLEVDLSLCQLEIRPGSSGQTGAELFLYGDLQAEHVRQEYKEKTGQWELKFDPPQVNVGSRYEAVLYVPRQLEKLELDAGMGSAVLADLELDRLELDSGMGSIQLENLVSASSELSADMGSIAGTADLGGTNEISCDMGSVELTVPAPAQYRAVVEN